MIKYAYLNKPRQTTRLLNCSGLFRVIKDRNMYVVFHAKPFSEIQTAQIAFNYVQIAFRVSYFFRKKYVKKHL